jgi:hypothetical protein
VELIMKKVYKTDLGSLVSIGFTALMFLGLTFLSFFAFGGAPLGIKFGTSFFAIFLTVGFFTMLKYDAIITDEYISAKIPALSLFNVYQTMRFDEIVEVFNRMPLFPETQMIVFKSRDKSKKTMSINVGFGLPWDALLDVMERLPKDVKITFEPELWKRIKKPLTNERVKKINKIAVIVIFLSLLWFSYYLWCVFKLHRVPFPINKILVK